jgi:hypothetical protein
MTRYTPQWLQQGSYPASVDRRLIGALWPSPASSGLAVTVASGMTVNIAPGQVAVPSSNNTGTMLCSSDAVEQPPALSAAPASPNNRIDLIICQVRGNDLDAGANNDFLFTTVTGVAATTPVAPAVPANAVALAQIYVPGNSASIVAGNITDLRPWGLSIRGPNALPPPNAASSVASFTDANGEVWVSKAGVNGGAWRKAKDVLHCKAARTGAWSTGGGTVPWDTTYEDSYGMYNTGLSAFVAPTGGIYQVSTRMQFSPTAYPPSVWYMNCTIALNGNLQASGVPALASTNGSWSATSALTTVRLAVGDKISITASGAASSALVPGFSEAFATFDYIGI